MRSGSAAALRGGGVRSCSVHAPGTTLHLTMFRLRRAAAGTRRRRRWPYVAFAVLALLSPALYSYTSMPLHASRLPLGVRSVEWLRQHHGNWLVDEVERMYYGSKVPKKGGPQ